MSKLFAVPKLGELQLDKVFFETYYPILFTCLNEKKELFLCVCCRANREGKKWLVTKTKPHVITSMLQNEMTVREAMTRYSDVQVSIEMKENKDDAIITWHDEQDWNVENSKSLPDAGEFLDAEDGEYEEEITYFHEMSRKDVGEELNVIENVLPQRVEFCRNYYIDFLEVMIEEISVHKSFETELYRTVFDIISKKLEQKAAFLVDVEEDNDALMAA